jgi:hypothetical protein
MFASGLYPSMSSTTHTPLLHNQINTTPLTDRQSTHCFTDLHSQWRLCNIYKLHHRNQNHNSTASFIKIMPSELHNTQRTLLLECKIVAIYVHKNINIKCHLKYILHVHFFLYFRITPLISEFIWIVRQNLTNNLEKVETLNIEVFWMRTNAVWQVCQDKHSAATQYLHL